MKACISLTFLALWIFLLSAACPVPGMTVKLSTVESRDVVVRYEEPLSGAAQDIVHLFPSLKDELRELLQWEIPFRPEVILIRDHQTFQMIADNDMVVAFADPERQVIVIDYSHMGAHPVHLSNTLKHELCHLLLHAYIPLLPRWFDEGVSQWVTGGIAEILVDANRPLPGEIALTGNFRLDDLSARFPEDRYGLMLAYARSLSLVKFIEATYGTPGLLRILNSLKSGRTMDDAVQESLGLSLPELERSWASHLRHKITWFIYVSNNLYEILFFFASIVAIVGAVKIIVKKLRDRSRRERETEEAENEHPE